MAVTEHDIEQYAARIRLHFAPQLRDVAYDLAYGIAKLVGAKVKSLRPETTLAEILHWLQEDNPFPSDSLDQVEWVMAMEEEFEFEMPDTFAAKTATTTFRDLVEHVARKRRSERER